MFKKILVFLVFVSSCGPLKMDTAKACTVDYSEAMEVHDIATDMIERGESCDAVNDFLVDTALDHQWAVTQDPNCTIYFDKTQTR